MRESVTMWTTAPEDFDYSGTNTVKRFAYGGRSWRCVSITKPLVEEQVLRYNSGLHCAIDYDPRVETVWR